MISKTAQKPSVYCQKKVCQVTVYMQYMSTRSPLASPLRVTPRILTTSEHVLTVVHHQSLRWTDIQQEPIELRA